MFSLLLQQRRTDSSTIISRGARKSTSLLRKSELTVLFRYFGYFNSNFNTLGKRGFHNLNVLSQLLHRWNASNILQHQQTSAIPTSVTPSPSMLVREEYQFQSRNCLLMGLECYCYEPANHPRRRETNQHLNAGILDAQRFYIAGTTMILDAWRIHDTIRLIHTYIANCNTLNIDGNGMCTMLSPHSLLGAWCPWLLATYTWPHIPSMLCMAQSVGFPPTTGISKAYLVVTSITAPASGIRTTVPTSTPLS